MPQKILVYSTDEVYGPTPAGVVFDKHAPFKPSNAYSASKVGVEGLAHSFFVTHQMPIVVVRRHAQHVTYMSTRAGSIICLP